MKLANANVVITGGSRGIGAKMARSFTEAGANVCVVARSADQLAKVAEPLGAHAIVADLTNASDLDGLVARCTEEFGPIDVWVNNAGIETSDAFAAIDRDELRTLCRLNFEAPVLLTRDVLGQMLERSRGHIVQVSSVAGAIPFPGLTAYAGSKAGLTNFSESLRLELDGTGVGITVVSPGPVDGEMWDRVENQDEPTYAQPALDRFRMMGFLPKLDAAGLADQVVAAVAGNERFVRSPARFSGYHILSNAPRRLVEVALTGVRLNR